MAIKRLHEGYGVDGDSVISGRFPMSEQDIRDGTEGLYLGRNPEDQRRSMYITYWEADEIAQKIGFPHIEVYKAQLKELQDLRDQVAELERMLDEEVHDLQLKAVSTEIKNAKKEIVNAVEGYRAAVAGRLSAKRGVAGAVPTPSADS